MELWEVGTINGTTEEAIIDVEDAEDEIEDDSDYGGSIGPDSDSDTSDSGSESDGEMSWALQQSPVNIFVEDEQQGTGRASAINNNDEGWGQG